MRERADNLPLSACVPLSAWLSRVWQDELHRLYQLGNG